MLDKVDLESKKLPETFCSVPWLQIHTEADGKIMPCCYYSHDDIHRFIVPYHGDGFAAIGIS